MYHPIYSYLTPPPKARGRSRILDLDKDWLAESSRERKLWRRSRPPFQGNAGRKKLVKWVPHLWRLQRRVEKMRSERIEKI